MLTDERWTELLHVRATNPGAVRQAYATRRRRPRLLSDQGTLFLVTADQGAVEDRRELLERLLVALANPAVDGVLGTPDVVEELLLLDALHDKVVFGSMNREDGFTGYDAGTLVDCGLDGGKMLLRLPGTASARQACADAVTELAAYGLVAMIELAEDPESLAWAVTVASALGTTSAHTWLKLPSPGSAAVLGATTLPVVLGGPPAADPASWMLWHGVVRGLVMDPTQLGGSVGPAVEAAAKALEEAAK
ncbi:Cgl0159 family (beta/alpha)8-fold protein [Amycolatopsis sp.]|uniref:Cgl0159 family (beta/alpha)8-fold protein n=1 Tax=Amycolatopsis sp. TaxID=37632 RepID=UPI002D7FC6D5|nr:aldolase [Amycolatopsis sp.]HET6711390.1 aldolase [Amycolatopsis sp.]